MIVTRQDINKAMTAKGGFTSKQVKWAKHVTGESKWAVALVGIEVTDSEWLKFANLGLKPKKVKNKPKIVNSISTKKDDWSWRPDDKDIPTPKFKGKLVKNQGKNKKKRNKTSKKVDYSFYKSREWLELRVRVLEKYECKCMMCGRSPKFHRVVIHVDHIKPRSKFPNLSLDFNNLQLLCAACNRGKSNKYETDWRPHEKDISNELDEEHLSNINHLI